MITELQKTDPPAAEWLTSVSIDRSGRCIPGPWTVPYEMQKDTCLRCVACPQCPAGKTTAAPVAAERSILRKIDWLHHPNPFKQAERLKRFQQQLKRYKLTPDEAVDLWLQQESLCSICRKPFDENSPPVLDHDHRTGTVRGFLHAYCNLMLGVMETGLKTPNLLNILRYLHQTFSYYDLQKVFTQFFKELPKLVKKSTTAVLQPRTDEDDNERIKVLRLQLNTLLKDPTGVEDVTNSRSSTTSVIERSLLPESVSTEVDDRIRAL